MAKLSVPGYCTLVQKDIVLWCNPTEKRSSASHCSDPSADQLVCGPDQFGHRSELHLFHYMSAMRFYRALASPEFAGDLLVELAGNHPREDLALTWGQGFVTRTEAMQEFASWAPFGATGKRGSNSLAQCCPLDRFR